MPEVFETEKQLPQPTAEFWARFIEQRREDRLDFRTTGFVYTLPDERLTPQGAPIRVWTVDVSTLGTKIRSYEPITSKRVLIELFMPQLSGTLIEAKVTRTTTEQAKFINGKEKESYLYGLQFSRMIPKDALTELPKPNSIQQELESGFEDRERATRSRRLRFPQALMMDEDTSHSLIPAVSAAIVITGLRLIVGAH